MTLPSLAVEYRTVEDLVRGLEDLERHFLLHGDRRGVFTTAYLQITRALQRELDAGGFQDPSWTTRYLVCFGNLYRGALLAYQRGDMESVPKAWRLSFQAAQAGTGFAIHHLILGINAHINHDLALALVELGIDPDRARKYQDHTIVNDVLERATAILKQQVSSVHAPLLQRLDRLAGRVDDDLTSFSIPKAREHAWTFAVALVHARDEPERLRLRRALNDQAAVLARLVLASNPRNPLVIQTVRIAERLDAAVRRAQLSAPGSPTAR